MSTFDTKVQEVKTKTTQFIVGWQYTKLHFKKIVFIASRMCKFENVEVEMHFI